jgi:hypothetical protein
MRPISLHIHRDKSGVSEDTQEQRITTIDPHSLSFASFEVCLVGRLAWAPGVQIQDIHSKGASIARVKNLIYV